jgi:hypothetical protein
MLHETGAARQRNIPDYDYLLQEREVSKLAEVVMKQIREREIEGFMFFIEPVANDPNVQRYLDALADACTRLSLPLCVVELK